MSEEVLWTLLSRREVEEELRLNPELSGRALAVLSEKRVQPLPNVPTSGESGFESFVIDIWYGILAPAATPRAIVDRLNREIVRILALPDLQQRLGALGAEAAPLTPAEFDRMIAEELAAAAKVARQAGIKPE